MEKRKRECGCERALQEKDLLSERESERDRERERVRERGERERERAERAR